MTTIILKYKDLTTEIQHMWNIKAKVILVITGATRTISKSFRQYLSNKLGRNNILQKKKKKQSYWALHVYFGKY